MDPFFYTEGDSKTVWSERLIPPKNKCKPEPVVLFNTFPGMTLTIPVSLVEIRPKMVEI